MIRSFAKWIGILLYIHFFVLLLPLTALGIGSSPHDPARRTRQNKRMNRSRPGWLVVACFTHGPVILDVELNRIAKLGGENT